LVHTACGNMAHIAAAGSLTRHLLFPIHHSLAPGLKALQTSRPVDPSLSPTTTSFLASLSTSPVSPIIPFRPAHSQTRSSDRSGQHHSPESSTRQRAPSSPTATRRRKRAAVPILLHDAPMQDHVSVGVQTWGSAILLGREMSLSPSAFGLFPGPSTPSDRGVRVLELGAGTGLLGILCRKLLDLRMASSAVEGDKYPGLVVATDYHHDVLANLKVCVDLNFPPRVPTATGGVVATKLEHEDDGVKIAKLDWTSFPAYMAGRTAGLLVNEEDNADVGQYVGESFDLVLASDCVYDPTHAKLLRDVAGWVLRLPDESNPGDIGGTMVSNMFRDVRSALVLTSAPAVPDTADIHSRAGEYRRQLPYAYFLSTPNRATICGSSQQRTKRHRRRPTRRRSGPVSRSQAGCTRRGQAQR